MGRHSLLAILLVTLVACSRTASVAPGSGQARTGDKSPIDHLILIYLENRTFDNLFGLFPGADGIAEAGASATQVDKDGKAYKRCRRFRARR